jgi:flavin reductase (DIM6/NTAB) family NADH-FMN oxidoreductase RutF
MNTAIRSIELDRVVAAGDFRSAMRHLAGGVSVITVGRGNDITGMTVTSVSSLAVDRRRWSSASTGHHRPGRY